LLAQSASIKKQVDRRTQSSILFGRWRAADKHGHALGHADDEDKELFRPELRIANLDLSAIGVKSERLLDFAKTTMAIVFDEQSSQLRKAVRLSNEQAMEGQRLWP